MKFYIYLLFCFCATKNYFQHVNFEKIAKKTIVIKIIGLQREKFILIFKTSIIPISNNKLINFEKIEH